MKFHLLCPHCSHKIRIIEKIFIFSPNYPRKCRHCQTNLVVKDMGTIRYVLLFASTLLSIALYPRYITHKMLTWILFLIALILTFIRLSLPLEISKNNPEK